jgi:flagellar motility protein MotE (MotC chaperone)
MAAKSDVKIAQTVREIEQSMLGPKKSNKSNSQHEVEDDVLIPAEKRPIGKFGVTMLTCLAWLMVMSGLVLGVMFDPTEDKVIRGWVILRLDPESEIREEFYRDEIIELQDDRRAFEEEKVDYEEALLLRHEELDELWEEIADAWEEIDDAWDEFFNRGQGEMTADIRHLAKSMESMDAAAAARILAEMDYEDAAKICLIIKKKKLGPILAEMDIDAALRITEVMIDEDNWD